MKPGEDERYSRQILFAGIGEAGQSKIRQASICIVGCGALGSFQAEALARAGIGRLRLIDRDYVDYTNLQRQWLYEETDAEHESPKAIAAAQRLRNVNSQVEIEALVSDMTPSNAEELVAGCDLILDGTDNFETRYLLNDLSVKLNIPWIYGAAVGSHGIVMPIVPDRGPCLACRLSGTAARNSTNMRCGWRARVCNNICWGVTGERGVTLACWLGGFPLHDPFSGCLARDKYAYRGGCSGRRMRGLRVAPIQVSRRQASNAGESLRKECGATPRQHQAARS